MNAKEDLIIDENNLDQGWIKQAHLYQQYSEELADAIKIQQETKDDLELLEAQFSKDIRMFPQKYEIDVKITEKLVERTIWLQEKYIDKKQEVVETNHNVNVLKGILSGFDHKKSALENLTKLFLSHYYAEPHISDSSKEKIEEHDDMRRASRVFKDE